MSDETMVLGRAFVRHQGACGERMFAPLEHGDALCERACPACEAQFRPGERVVLVPIGPGDSATGRAKARAGAWYNAVALAVHAQCAGLDTEVFGG